MDFLFGLLVASYLTFFAYLTVRHAPAALSLLLALLPTYLIRFSLGPLPVTLLELTIWVVFVSWFFSRVSLSDIRTLSFADAHAPQNPFAPYLLPILLFIATATASAVYSPEPVAALGIWKAYIIEPLMVFVMLVLTFRHRPERSWLGFGLGAGAIAIGCVALAQYAGIIPVPEPYASFSPVRFTSFYPFPNAVGLFVAPIVALSVGWLLWDIEHRRSDRWLWHIAVLVCGTLAIALSMTKGAIVGVVAGAFVATLVALRGRRRLVAAAFFILVAAALLLAPPARDRLFTEAALRSPSGIMRLVVWEETRQLLRDQPIAGAGLAGYQTALVPYHERWRPDVSPYALEIFLYPHNVVLNFWTELGLGGLLAFLWLLALFFRHAWVWRRHPTGVGALAAMVALLVHGLVDVPFFKNDLSVLFWAIMALPLVGGRQLHRWNLAPEFYDAFKSGLKRLEARRAGPNHPTVAIGDVVLCYRGAEGFTCTRAEVIALHHRPALTQLVSDFHPATFGYENETHAQESFAYYWGDDEGHVVGIELRQLD